MNSVERMSLNLFLKQKRPVFKPVLFSNQMVGTMGFEPMTPSTPRKCATKLRYVPNAHVS